MKAILAVFLGGGIGSVLRYLIARATLTWGLPLFWGTLTVNIVGSLLIGFLLGYSSRTGWLSNEQLLLLTVGFCGGFTTYSTFALEGQQFIKDGQFVHFGGYVLGTFILGILAVFLGLWLSRIGLEA